MLGKTIFAFLMLNTMSSAHNKIFGAKFLSFGRVRITGLYSVIYTVCKESVQKKKAARSQFVLQ